MQLLEYAHRLMALARTIFQWTSALGDIDQARREKVALYAEEIASTLSRATKALATLDQTPKDHAALLAATRELGRVSGYVETILSALERHLDGRKSAGVKKRLDYLQPFEVEQALAEHGAFRHATRLAAAEGFFRALADAMRT